jgi:CBS domain containing-hemolysin-like protein
LPEDDDYDTIAGFVLHQLRRIPEEGEQLSYGDVQLTIQEMKGRKIEKLLITRA